MTSAAKRTIDLAAEQSTLIDELDGSGRYRSEHEVIDAGLMALRDQHAVIENWLIDDVLPVAEAMRADPTRGRDADQVFDGLRALNAERTRSGARDA